MSGLVSGFLADDGGLRVNMASSPYALCGRLYVQISPL